MHAFVTGNTAEHFAAKSADSDQKPPHGINISWI